MTFNTSSFQQAVLTDPSARSTNNDFISTASSTSITTATWTSIPGISIVVTPRTNTTKVLLCASLQISPKAASSPESFKFRVLRNGSAVNINTDASPLTRTQCGLSALNNNDVSTSGGYNVSFNLIDSPNTTSACMYVIQVYSSASTPIIPMNQTFTDTNSAAFSRTTSLFFGIEL